MNKVITINLGGNAYQLEEGGYEILRNYLESAAMRLQANPDRDEILSDIEQAIAEKFRALLASHKSVVETKEVSAVLTQMGPIEADEEAGNTGASGSASGSGTPKAEQPPGGTPRPRRLYRIRDGEMVSGVCNGLAAYFGIDPTFVRLAFVLLTVFGGTGVLIYLVMVIVVPEAHTPEEKAAASGSPATAQEFIRRAKEGYYGAMKNFPDRTARREWQRQFRREMRANADHWRYKWHGYWAERVSAHPGMGFVLPFLSLLEGVVRVLLVCALLSLLANGNLFGVALPANVPVWIAAVLLLLGYGILAGPLKAARRFYYWGCGKPGGAMATAFVLDATVWLVVVLALVWMAIHYFPELREAVQGVPPLIHQATNDIRSWWHGK
jgi:phage shock protein PspC (stress-responsive transcriptional regulator)